MGSSYGGSKEHGPIRVFVYYTHARDGLKAGILNGDGAREEGRSEI